LQNGRWVQDEFVFVSEEKAIQLMKVNEINRQ